MKTKWLFITAMALIATSAFANEKGNGGGVIVRDGNVITFGSAHVQVTEDSLESVPGYETFKEAILRMPLSPEMRALLAQASYPIGERKYFSLPKGALGKKDKARLVASYLSAIHQNLDAKDVGVSAITSGKETYLLPEFFQLKPVEQAAILLHEALWVVDRGLEYATVIDLEIRFQHYLETHAPAYGYDRIFWEKLSDAVSCGGRDNLGKCEGRTITFSLESLKGAIQDDMDHGRLAAYVDEAGNLSVPKLLGDDFSGKPRLNELRLRLIDRMAREPRAEVFGAFLAVMDRVVFAFGQKMREGQPHGHDCTALWNRMRSKATFMRKSSDGTIEFRSKEYPGCIVLYDARTDDADFHKQLDTYHHGDLASFSERASEAQLWLCDSQVFESQQLYRYLSNW